MSLMISMGGVSDFCGIESKKRFGTPHTTFLPFTTDESFVTQVIEVGDLSHDGFSCGSIVTGRLGYHISHR